MKHLSLSLCLAALAAAGPSAALAQTAQGSTVSEPNTLAADCLSRDSIMDLQVENSRTLRVTLKSGGDDFLMRVRDACFDEQINFSDLEFEIKSELACIGPGDVVAYSPPGIATRNCEIEGLTVAANEGDTVEPTPVPAPERY